MQNASIHFICMHAQCIHSYIPTLARDNRAWGVVCGPPSSIIERTRTPVSSLIRRVISGHRMQGRLARWRQPLFGPTHPKQGTSLVTPFFTKIVLKAAIRLV